MSLDVRKIDGFWYADGYVDLDFPKENTVINDKIIVEGDARMGDLEDMLALAVAIDQQADFSSSLQYTIADHVDFSGDDDEDDYADDIYIDCTVYDGRPVYLDQGYLAVDSVSRVPKALKAIEKLAAEEEDDYYDESYRRPRRIKVNGALYEAVEGRTEIPVPTFRDIAVSRDVDSVNGDEMTIFFDGLVEGDFLYAKISFINYARSSRTPLEIDLSEIELPIDGYAITLRRGGSTNRSIKPFAILTYEDRDEAIRDYDRVVKYALTDLDIDLDDSRSAVRTLNKLAASIESKFGFTHV